jgi:hypothetical protein
VVNWADDSRHLRVLRTFDHSGCPTILLAARKFPAWDKRNNGRSLPDGTVSRSTNSVVADKIAKRQSVQWALDLNRGSGCEVKRIWPCGFFLW